MHSTSNPPIFSERERVQHAQNAGICGERQQEWPDRAEGAAFDHDFFDGSAAIVNRRDIADVSEPVGDCVEVDQPGKEHLRDDGDGDELNHLEFRIRGYRAQKQPDQRGFPRARRIQKADDLARRYGHIDVP